MLKKKLIATAMMLSMTLGGAVTLTPAAQARDYYGYNHYYSNRDRGYMTEHPYVQKALIGGGVGAVAGGLLGGDGGRADGAIKGALLGAGVGLGYQYLRNQGTFRNW